MSSAPAPPAFPKDSKPWDPQRPFWRVGSPSFNLKSTVNGDGHAMGTRRAADFPSAAIGIAPREALRLTPSWVRTQEPLENSLTAERASEQEVYGQLIRSFQTWTDAPGLQWHRWYDWNFHVRPVSAFDWLRGPANRGELPALEGEVSVAEHSLECEWDTAFGWRPGAMFNVPDSGRMGIDMAWPMTGDWVWLAGRSIYDGGHEFGRPELCRSELHPVKAVANVRREAFRFAEVGHFVPAIQFAFFASKLGGYVCFDQLSPPRGHYEFLVDLPLAPDEFASTTHAVGSTPELPFNRIVLRRLEPLIHFDFTSHQNVRGAKLSPAELDQKFRPLVTFEIPDPSKPRQVQARIRIDLQELDRLHIDSYGVIVSMGWPDRNKTQGRRIKRCRVDLVNLHPANIGGDIFSADEWRFKVCVNNRWFQWERDGIFDEDHILFPEVNFPLALPGGPLEFFLEEDEAIKVHTHGSDLNLMDDPIADQSDEVEGGADARTVKFNRIQLFAEALRAGEDPTTAVPGDPLLDVAALGLPLAILEAVEAIPVIGDAVALVELIASIVGLSPQQLLGVLGEQTADWKRHIDIQPPRAGDHAYVMQRVIARNVVHLLSGTLKDGNAPLGICDPGHSYPEETNPLPVKDRNDAAPQLLVLKGLRTREDDPLAELFEPDRKTLPHATLARGGSHRDKVQYELTYSVQITPQFE